MYIICMYILFKDQDYIEEEDSSRVVILDFFAKYNTL